jgi:hypothetical protein
MPARMRHGTCKAKLRRAAEFQNPNFNAEEIGGRMTQAVTSKIEIELSEDLRSAKPDFAVGRVRAAYKNGMAEAARIAREYMKTGVNVDDIYSLAQEAGGTAAMQAKRMVCSDMNEKPEAWKARTVQILLDAGCKKSGEELARMSSVDLEHELIQISLTKADDESPMQALARQLKLVKACSRPSTSIQAIKSGDAPQMVASQKKDWKGVQPDKDDLELQFLPNICASCALMAMAVFDDPANDVHAAEMTDLLIEVGMEQISPEAREQLLVQRVALLGKVAPVKIGEALADNADLVETCVNLLPYSEGAAKMLRALPDRAVDEEDVITGTDARRIVAALLKPLPLEAAVTLFEGCVKGGERAKARGCATYLAEAFAAIAEGKLDRLSPTARKSRVKLSDPLGEFGAAPDIGKDEAGKLKIRFDKALLGSGIDL